MRICNHCKFQKSFLHMEIVDIAVKDLVPYDKNPRRNDEAAVKVAESIKQFGFKIPLVVDRNNVVVCGHTRLKAAKKLKLKTVPCIRADDLSEDQIKAFRLVDNRTAEIAEWDFADSDERNCRPVLSPAAPGFRKLEQTPAAEAGRHGTRLFNHQMVHVVHACPVPRLIAGGEMK